MKDCLVKAKVRLFQAENEHGSPTDSMGAFVGESLGQHYQAAQTSNQTTASTSDTDDAVGSA